MGYPVYFDGTVEVSPPLTEEHARLVEAVVNLEKTELTKPVFDAINASPAPDLPYHVGQLYVSEDRANSARMRARAAMDCDSGWTSFSRMSLFRMAMC